MTPTEGSTVTGRPSIDPRIRQRRVAIRRTQGRRRLWWIVAAVALVALVALAVGLLHTPWFSAKVVTVSGAHAHTSEAAIVAAAGLEHHPDLISVDPGATAAKVERLPYIASAEVHRHWPDGVEISVTERIPVAAMAGPGASWSVLDGHGRTLQVLPAHPPALATLVVHTPGGLAQPQAVGRSLPSSSSFGLTVARTLPLAFSAQVVSVTEAPDKTVTLALNSGLTVLMGTDTDLLAKYKDVASIIGHADLHGATTLDVTVPQSPTVTG